MVRTAIICLLILLAGFAGVQNHAPQPAHAIETDAYCATGEELVFLGLINDYRAQNGLAPLVLTQTLGAAAEHHSIDMAENNYFSHTLSDGTTWSQNISNHGYTFNTYRAENIAAGNSSASNTFIQWKNSAGHNANMLNVNYRAIGIGYAYEQSSTYDHYWTTVFGGVVDAEACSDVSEPTATSTAHPTNTATPRATSTATPRPTPTSTSAPPTVTATRMPPTATVVPSETPKPATSTPTPTSTHIAPTATTAPPTATVAPTATKTVLERLCERRPTYRRCPTPTPDSGPTLIGAAVESLPNTGTGNGQPTITDLPNTGTGSRG
jgi:uncharacterized protein YkwD